MLNLPPAAHDEPDEESEQPPAPRDEPDEKAAQLRRPLRLVPPSAEPAKPAPSYQQAPLGPVEPAPILRHKVQPPPLRTSTLSRQRLLDRLAWATKSRVTLVVADAGYGKSTLLADFSRRFDGIALWYSLQPDDLDWLALVPHLVAAAREAKPDFGALTTSLLRAEPGIAPPKSAVISGLLSELTTLHEGRVVIIFDDVHAIEESPDANDLLERIVNQAPPTFSFVFAGRRRPAIPLARWAGRGELTEITTDDLRFTREDTARLFADSYGQALDPEVLDELEARTQGWAACLQLFSTLISGLSPVAIRQAAHSLSGSGGAVFDYLAQEVVAKLRPDLQAYLTRASLVHVISPQAMHALFPEKAREAVDELARDADALGLVGRASRSSEGREFHPLLREYLGSELQRRHTVDEIRAFHRYLARASANDPLVACHHYIEAGDHDEAVWCLSSSTLQTLGSGLSGTAVRLAERLSEQPPSGAVAVLRARRLLEVGDLGAAASVLEEVDVGSEDPAVRAALRQTALNRCWRAGDSSALVEIVEAILDDPDTPQLLRDIALMFRDSGPAATQRMTLAALEQRLEEMARVQDAAGYRYYAAVSLHNAAVVALHAGRLYDSLRLAESAMERHRAVAVRPPDYYSTVSVLAHVSFELGRTADAETYATEAMSPSDAEADVAATISIALAAIGDRARATRLLDLAEAAERDGRTDFSARAATRMARAWLQLPTDPLAALRTMSEAPRAYPLDGGEVDGMPVVEAVAHLLAGNVDLAEDVAAVGLEGARTRGNRLALVRFLVLRALAREKADDIATALEEAEDTSALAVAQLADAIAAQLHLVVSSPALERSIDRYRARWVPVLRRALDAGNDPRAHAAAALLDRFGDQHDIGRLRAFEKTYRRRPGSGGLGKALARRVSPKLRVRDLGLVELTVGSRGLKLGEIRRRSGSVLMYLVTRPNFVATREQVIEDMWPDGPVRGGTNSLNQSLYFLRREIDPWFEDGMSPEYVRFEAEVVSLDPELVSADSVSFLTRSRAALAERPRTDELKAVLGTYRGQFAPEFEYEEWAIGWRTRVHAAYLDCVMASIHELARQRDYRGATDIALAALSVDPDASDVERALIWLYARSGAPSAAQTQYAHYAANQRTLGLPAPSLRSVVDAADLG